MEGRMDRRMDGRMGGRWDGWRFSFYSAIPSDPHQACIQLAQCHLLARELTAAPSRILRRLWGDDGTSVSPQEAGESSE